LPALGVAGRSRAAAGRRAHPQHAYDAREPPFRATAELSLARLGGQRHRHRSGAYPGFSHELSIDPPVGDSFLIDGVGHHRPWRGSPTERARVRGRTPARPLRAFASVLPRTRLYALPAWGILVIRAGEKTVIAPSARLTLPQPARRPEGASSGSPVWTLAHPTRAATTQRLTRRPGGVNRNTDSAHDFWTPNLDPLTTRAARLNSVVILDATQRC